MIRRVLIALLFAFAVHADEVIDNAAVIKMVKGGLSADVVMIKIDQSAARFDVSTDALIALKAAGVPDGVIKSMLLKQPSAAPAAVKPPAPPAAQQLPPADRCINATHYALGTNGWAWVPASVCLTPREISVDEQDIALERVTTHCFTKASVLGDAEWWFTDGKEVFKFRGRENELRELSSALVHAVPAAKNGSCTDRSIIAAMPK